MMEKLHFATILVLVVGALQVTAWYFNKNGAVFALTSLVIGGIAGAIFGYKNSKTK